MFIINESILNGTVTMDANQYLIKEKTWDAAVKKVKKNKKIKIISCDKESLQYMVPQTNSPFKVVGIMKNKPVSI